MTRLGKRLLWLSAMSGSRCRPLNPVASGVGVTSALPVSCRGWAWLTRHLSREWRGGTVGEQPEQEQQAEAARENRPPEPDWLLVPESIGKGARRHDPGSQRIGDLACEQDEKSDGTSEAEERTGQFGEIARLLPGRRRDRARGRRRAASSMRSGPDAPSLPLFPGTEGAAIQKPVDRCMIVGQQSRTPTPWRGRVGARSKRRHVA